MRPDVYRRVNYNRQAKTNNFYNGALLMSELNDIPDKLDLYDVYREQKEAAMTYHATLLNERFLQGLNYDLQSSVTTQAKTALASTNLSITNKLNSDIDTIISTYNPTVTNIKAIANSKEQQQAIYLAAQSAAQSYINILKTISSSMGPIKSSTLSSSIQNCETKIDTLLTNCSDLRRFQSYFFAIFYALQKTRGYVLEEESVNKLNNQMPSNIQFTNFGNLYVGGQLAPGGADLAGFTQDIMEAIQMTWQQAPIGKSNNKVKQSGSLKDFLNNMDSYSSTHSFYFTEDTYALVMQQAILAAQAKATGTMTKNIKFRTDVNLFAKDQIFVDISNKKRVGTARIPTVSFVLKQYQSQYSRALEKMRSLYELSTYENKGKSNNLNASKQYRMLLNMQLSKMFPWIMQYNEMVLTPQYGLISLANLFQQKSGIYFYYGTASNKGTTALDLTKLESYRNSIMLRMT